MRPVLSTRPGLWTRKAGRYQLRGRGAGWVVALVAGIVCLGACQSKPAVPRAVPPAPQTVPLAERVKAFWDARLQGDEVSAYQYITYARTGELTQTQFVQARSPTLKYMAYTIDTIQEQENQAQVTVNVQYQLTVPGMVDLPMAMPIKGHWVRLEDNQWYRNMKPEKSGKTADKKG